VISASWRSSHRLGNRIPSVPQLTTTESTVVLVLSILGAFLGYRLSENDRKNLGRTPWGLPSLVWALFWFLSLVIGPVLYFIAHWVGVRRARQSPPAVGPPGPARAMGMVANRGPTVAEQFPAYPQPANVRPVGEVPGGVDASADASSATPASAGPAGSSGGPGRTETPDGGMYSPPAWHPDPSGRFHYRWWDGRQWTSQVSTDGQHLIDTNPDQRIGPY
jgi:hypothetical protein